MKVMKMMLMNKQTMVIIIFQTLKKLMEMRSSIMVTSDMISILTTMMLIMVVLSEDG